MIDRLLSFVPVWAWLALAGGLAMACGWLYGGKVTAERHAAAAELALSRLETKVQAANAEAARAAAELSNKVIEAQNEATKRQATLKAAADSARAAADSLRAQLAAIRSNSTGTEVAPASGAIDPAAVATVLGDCAREYSELAAKADGHASDLRTLMDAWPR